MVRGYFRIQIQIVLTAEKNLSVERVAADAKENLQIVFYNFTVSERSIINLNIEVTAGFVG